ncbi:MAG: NUDIX hydrolase, partial [Verrucomicrobia bacterium]|nr:NUDIX hydrolase [Verrucomicrobiota bacterium]
MDWTRWLPSERANLCFIIKDRRVLLIRKKRGLGAGKINAPG